MSPGGNAKTDITDIYAFQKPGDDDKSILILNVNPLAPTLAKSFEDKGLYQLKIDTDGDALAEVAFRIQFTPVDDDGRQWATVRRDDGTNANDDENSGEVIIEHAPVSFGSEAHVTKSGDYRFFAGLRSDPFFFDLIGFLHNFSFTGSDFFPRHTQRDKSKQAIEKNDDKSLKCKTSTTFTATFAFTNREE